MEIIKQEIEIQAEPRGEYYIPLPMKVSYEAVTNAKVLVPAPQVIAVYRYKEPVDRWSHIYTFAYIEVR